MTSDNDYASLSRRMSGLALPDRVMLEHPLDVEAMYDFHGQASYGELSYAKGDRLRVYCEDMGAGWSLAMLLGEDGLNERATTPGHAGITRGLIAQGFYRPCLVAATPLLYAQTGSIQQASEDGSLEPPGDSQSTSTTATVQLMESLSETTDIKHVTDSTDSMSSAETSIAVLTPSLSKESSNTPPLRPRQVSSSILLKQQQTRKDAVETFLTTPTLVAAARPRRPGAQFSMPPTGPTYYVEDGKWVCQHEGIYKVAIPNYETRSNQGAGEHTVFEVTSIFSTCPSTHTTSTGDKVALHDSGSEKASSDKTPTEQSATSMTCAVYRRYTHFAHLHLILHAMFPLIIIPDLPTPKVTGRFGKDFLDGRRRDLERWLRRVIRHSLARESQILRDFLTVQDDQHFEQGLYMYGVKLLTDPADTFFRHVEHDADYFDEQQLLDDTNEEFERASRHFSAIEKGGGIEAMLRDVGKYRMGVRDAGLGLKELSHSLLRHASGLAQSSEIPAHVDAAREPSDPTARARHRAHTYGLSNSQGALCWRNDCEECMRITLACTKTAESLSVVANLYEANAKTVLLPPQELLVELSQPHKRYKKLLSTQHTAQTKLAAAIQMREDGELFDNDILSKCETVLNAVSSELSHIHEERAFDMKILYTNFLDGQIAFHEHALSQLRTARSSFSPPIYEKLGKTPTRMPSLLEKAACAPSAAPSPLSEPSGFGLPSTSTSSSLMSLQSFSALGNVLATAAGSLWGWRSASSAIAAQDRGGGVAEEGDSMIGSPSMAMSRFVQFLDWTVNARGEDRKHLQ